MQRTEREDIEHPEDRQRDGRADGDRGDRADLFRVEDGLGEQLAYAPAQPGEHGKEDRFHEGGDCIAARGW